MQDGSAHSHDWDDDRTLIAGPDTLLSETRKGVEGEACLIVVRGDQQGKRHELSAATTSIGRDVDADIVLKDPKVSRRQALIRKSEESVTLVDAGSTNGTFINDRRLEPNASVVLEKEDMIRIGGTVLKYLPRGAPEIRYIGLLEDRANTDPLTGTFNKGYLLNALQAEFKRAKALRSAFSVMFIDLDHFKLINDTYGHDNGDRVLIETSAVLREATRFGQALLGRFGGEEFVVLLPKHDQGETQTLAESVRARIEKHDFRLDDRIIRVTASIGIASLDNDMTEAAELLKRADQALYRAKRGGRNRTNCG